jgi:ribosomal protein S6--L-glutamate ligase
MKGILLTRNTNLHSNTAFLNAARSKNIEFEIVSFLDCEILNKSLYRNNEKLNFDFIIPRIGILDSELGLSIFEAIEDISKYNLNSLNAIKNCKNKMLTYEKLKRVNIKIPKTLFAKDHDDLTSWSHDDIVIKPVDGMKGFGVERVSFIKDLDYIKGKIKEYKGLMIQEFLESNSTDYRLIIFNHEYFGGIGRRNKLDFRSNINCGGEAFKVNFSQEKINLAIRASRALDSRFVAVDIIEHNNQNIVLECNDCPGLESIESTLGRNICESVFDDILRAFNE